MHIIVIGAGIIGMTTAYYLVQDGHTVTVVDGGGGPGQATSKANGAQLSYSFVAPLAEPSVLPKLPFWLLNNESPLRLRLACDPNQWRWGLAFLRACRSGMARRTTAELFQLGLHSRSLMHELVKRDHPSFDFKSVGKLLVFQDARAYAAALQTVDYQATLGCEQRVLDRQACVELEPALEGIRNKIAGGIFTATEDVGDCMRLCTELERILRSAPTPANFMFNTKVTRLHSERNKLVALETSAGDMQADAYVIAGGIGSQPLARKLGMDLSVYPLKGYSLTYELTPESVAPTTNVSDVHNKVVYARLGSRLRVAGMVDIGSATTQVDPRRIASLKREVRTYLPHLNAAAEPEAWAGLRPARPSGKPLIGPTPYRNLWLNVGHGALGFTLAAGSAGLLADQIASRPGVIPQSVFAFR